MMTQTLTHRFARRETLERARYWLSQLGFAPDSMHLGSGSDHRITLPVEAAMVAKIRMIFDALDHGERSGWHESEDLVQQVRRDLDATSHRLDAAQLALTPHDPLIHWQGLDPCISEEMREYGLNHGW